MDTMNQGMPCPVCRTQLVAMERQGVEIDHCPNCRGVWLDRGELDKILERSANQAQVWQSVPPEVQPQPAARDYDDRRHDGDHRGHKPHRRKSFFEELFD